MYEAIWLIIIFLVVAVPLCFVSFRIGCWSGRRQYRWKQKRAGGES